jgi:hypothetical protein
MVVILNSERRNKVNEFLSTQSLEKHIRDTYAKIESYAKKDGVYRPLEDYFATTTPNGRPGSFCYADEEGYHFGVIDIRGNIKNSVTQSLSDITYQVLQEDIFWMSYEYERKNRLENQDNRRIMFDKILQYWSVIGEYYVEREKKKISEALKNNPFVD